MTETSRAKGCLVGLACGDALGRPVEFMSAGEITAKHGEVTEMVGEGVHGKPAGTITDDTEMALCIAESLVEQNGFKGGDVASRFVDWLDSDPFDIGSMTRDSLVHIRDGTPWQEAGIDVWENRPEGANAGNGSVMRCAPYAVAFRHFPGELTYVSRLSSAITHADPRCQYGCVLLNRTLANLIRDEADPLTQAVRNTWDAPDELRAAAKAVQEALSGDRERGDVEQQLSTSGYVVDSLQAGLFYGLTADSAKQAVVQAVNKGGDTDTVGAIAGAVAGARFGRSALPTEWTETVDESDRLERLAKQLLQIRLRLPGKQDATVDDGSIIFKHRTIEGPAYIPVREFQEATIGHRPHPAPHRGIRIEYDDLTSAKAAMLDWERRAYAVHSGRCDDYVEPELDIGGAETPRDKLVAVPQYPFVETFTELPEQDRQRIKRDAREVGEAFIRSFAAYAAIRHPITETTTEPIGIERMDPIAGATRILMPTFGEAGDAILGTKVTGGYETPAGIEDAFEPREAERILTERPAAVVTAAGRLTELSTGVRALLEYVTHVQPLEQKQTDDRNEEAVTAADLRMNARSMVGELHVAYDPLRRIAVRHPEVEPSSLNNFA